jgi:signal peptidase
MMKTKKALSALNRAALIFLVMLLLTNLYIMVQKIVLHNDLPKVLGFSQLIVVSGSMQPAIDAGDLVVIRQQKKYNVGDIVTLRSGNSLVTHRIIDMDQEYVHTKGDANNVADQPMPLSSIQGKVILRVPSFGRLLLFLKTPFGITMITIVGGLLIVAPFMASLLKRSRMR